MVKVTWHLPCAHSIIEEKVSTTISVCLYKQKKKKKQKEQHPHLQQGNARENRVRAEKPNDSAKEERCSVTWSLVTASAWQLQDGPTGQSLRLVTCSLFSTSTSKLHDGLIGRYVSLHGYWLQQVNDSCKMSRLVTSRHIVTGYRKWMTAARRTDWTLHLVTWSLIQLTTETLNPDKSFTEFVLSLYFYTRCLIYQPLRRSDQHYSKRSFRVSNRRKPSQPVWLYQGDHHSEWCWT